MSFVIQTTMLWKRSIVYSLLFLNALMNTHHIVAIMTKQRLTLATAESCTGGLIAHSLTDVPGSSAVLKGGVVAYANEAKTRMLGVPAALIKAHGAVSRPVALALAAGAQKKFRADYALATTGIAGPGGGTPQKPVGLVFIALATPQRVVTKKCFFAGSRQAVKAQACRTALALLASVI